MIDFSVAAKHIPPEVLRPAPIEIQEVDRDNLRVQYRFQRYESEGEVVRFWGGVRAFYGPTIIECEELILRYSEKKGEAVGQVKLTDPDGELTAAFLRFDWGAKTGSVQNVDATVAGMKLRISSLEISPEQWFATGVTATPSKTNPAEIEFTASRLLILPGKSAKASKPGLRLFGQEILSIPFYDFNLDRRVTGLRPPSPLFKRGQGLGLAWGSEVLLNDQTSLAGQASGLPRRYPEYQIEVTNSPLLAGTSRARLATRPDTGDWFRDSWFDSILSPSIAEESFEFSQKRNSISLGSYWSQSTRGRLGDTDEMSKPIDLAAELGGTIGDWRGLGQLRLQRVRSLRQEPYVDRLQARVIAHSGFVPIAEKLGLVLRVDGTGFISRDQGYGWLRAAGYFVVQPDRRLTLAAGAQYAIDGGREHFLIDRLFSKSGVHLRGDLNLGSIRASSLIKYDFDRSDWYDVEYGFSFVAGSFEPYLNYRQFPRELQFGVRLRIDEFLDLLSQRSVQRRSVTN